MQAIKIDKARLELVFKKFEKYVKERSGCTYISFQEKGFLDDEEGYKSKIRLKQHWKRTDIGTGNISTCLGKSMEKNNLVDRYTQKYFQNMMQENQEAAEEVLFSIYNDDVNEKLFSELTKFFGKKYDLISYLLFLKDQSRFLPVRPENMERAFSLLNIDYKMSRRCEWNNYIGFIDLVRDIKYLLEDYFDIEVRLIDAHSFLWIIRKFTLEEEPAHEAQLEISESAREKEGKGTATVRYGQSGFRDGLIQRWDGRCSVTGCDQTDLLIASHIKPWAVCNENNEWIDINNGLLLSPNLDSTFDKGYISFANDGMIMISSLLPMKNRKILGITSDMKLRITPGAEQQKYLEYHRENIFRH